MLVLMNIVTAFRLLTIFYVIFQLAYRLVWLGRHGVKFSSAKSWAGSAAVLYLGIILASVDQLAFGEVARAFVILTIIGVALELAVHGLGSYAKRHSLLLK